MRFGADESIVLNCKHRLKMTSFDLLAKSGPVVTNACVSFGTHLILGPISLTLHESRIGIIGRNGSGKSTLLALLAGLITPSAGQVLLEGFDPAKDRSRALRAVGVLFQNPDRQIIFPTVDEELAFGLKQLGHKDPKGAVNALLEREGRADWAGRSVAALSQGQRQYLCLMAVLAMEPRTVLLDEPLSGLDLPTAARLMARLNQAPQRLITISHDQKILARYDRVIWIEAGLVKADGPPQMVIKAYDAEMARLAGEDADTDLRL
ncbi:MAG: biotin transport system ATP-binding protein [Paracoccaceae bacterium]